MIEEKYITQITCDLVRLPSESSKPVQSDPLHPEKAVFSYLTDILTREGISHYAQDVLNGRQNILFNIPAENKPKLIIAAHLDTVSASGMNKPFAAEISNGKIFGRGACDDKGPMAVAVCTLISLIRRNIKLAFDVTFIGTVDEECTLAGAAKAGQLLKDWDLCLVLEPTCLKIVNGHKGDYRFKVTTNGKAAHSSTPRHGENAVDKMLAVANDLRGLQDSLPGASAHFDGSTLSITQIQGGTASNIIPSSCSVSADLRFVPDMPVEMIQNIVRDCVKDRGKIEDIFAGNGFYTTPDLPPLRNFKRIHHNHNLDDSLHTVSFATDGSRLANHGPCIVWGPGDIAQAHSDHEFIEISQLTTAASILGEFLTV